MVVWLALPEVIRYDKIGEKNKFCEKSLFNSFDISKTIQKSLLHPQKNKREAFWPAYGCRGKWEMAKRCILAYKNFQQIGGKWREPPGGL